MDGLYHVLLDAMEGAGGAGATGWLLFGGSLLLGAAHTLGPGHGKSLLLGVLVAESRRPLHALKMALVIGLTHMADVMVLSLLSIFAVSWFSTGAMTPWLSRLSGAGILILGILRLTSALRGGRRADAAAGGEPDDHGPAQHHRRARERRNLLTAFLYSLAPCPGAWVLFMACLGLGKPLLGVLMLAGFTAGLLATIGGLALTMVYSFSWLGDRLPAGTTRLGRWLSGGVVTALGAWMLLESPTSHSHLPGSD